MTPISFNPLIHVVQNLLWLVPAFLTLAALKLLFASKVKGAAGEAAVAVVLNRAAPKVLHDIIIPDGRGGLTQIDHVALLPGGLLAVETKNYAGRIFGKNGERTWTQRLGRRSYKTNNPVRQNHGHVQALKALLPGVRIDGLVVFAGDAKFPNGMPDGVTTVRGLRAELARLAEGDGDGAGLDAAWERLNAAARKDRATRREHLEYVYGLHGKKQRVPVALGLLAVAGIFAIGLLLR